MKVLPHSVAAEQRSSPRWGIVAAAELVLAGLAIVLDLAIPTLVVLALAGASLGIRRQGLGSLGFRRLRTPFRSTGTILALTAGWTLLQIGLVMPVANRVTGDRQDVSTFVDLKGNLPLLIVLVVASWTLAAVGEETVFRGYLPTRVQELGSASGSRALDMLAVVGPAVLFCLIHREQGQVGVVVTFLDALFFMWVRVRYDTVWAAVLAHGFSNTIGLCTFFVVGPVYGLW